MKLVRFSAMIALMLCTLVFATSCGPAPEAKASSEPPATSQAPVATEAVSADGPGSGPAPYQELLPFSETNPDFATDYGFTGDFVFPESNARKLAEDTFDPLDNNESDPITPRLPIARNEILARHGYVFKTPVLQSYFGEKAWYKPDPSFKTDALSSVEKYNLSLLEFWERKYYEYNGNSKLGFNKKGNGITLYPPDQPQSIDLNGDGIPEKILWSPKVDENEDTGDDSSVLMINDQRFEATSFQFDTRFGITDIDASDPLKEIIITDYLEGDDTDSSTIYGFDGNKFTFMGEILGNLDYGITVNGSGKFIADIYGNLLENLRLEQTYKMTDTHRIEPVPQDTYLTNSLVFVKQPIQLFSERDLSKPSFLLPEGAIVTLISTDAQAWCQAETSNGNKGWFSVKDRTIVHEGLHADEALLGLYNEH